VAVIITPGTVPASLRISLVQYMSLIHIVPGHSAETTGPFLLNCIYFKITGNI